MTIDLDKYSQQKARKLFHPKFSNATGQIVTHQATPDEVAAAIKDAYQQGAADQKRGAVQAIEAIEIDDRFDRSDFMRAVKAEALAAISSAQPVAGPGGRRITKPIDNRRNQ